MTCFQYREALSARMDGEPPGIDQDTLAAHLATCPDCASWLRDAQYVTRLARVAPAVPVSDRSAEIVAAAKRAIRPRRVRATLTRLVPSARFALVLRIALALVAAGQMMLAYPSLVLGEDSMAAPVHVAHETGAWNGALAVAFLWAALRPRNSIGLLPLLSAFVVTLFTVSLPDLLGGAATFARVGPHLVAAAGLACIAALALRYPRPRRTAGARTVVGWSSARPAGDPRAEPRPTPRRHGDATMRRTDVDAA